jgi:hypothetical protein
MAKSSTKIVEQHFDYEDLDDTMPLATLDHLLEQGDPTSDQQQESAGDIGQESILSQLSRLAELSESIDRRLEKIAGLLAKPQTQKEPAATRRKRPAASTKKSTKKPSKKTTKRSRTKAASSAG